MSELVDRWIESLQILAGDDDNPTAEQRAEMAVVRRKMLDEYAHELAEQQRAWIADRTDMPWWADEIPAVIDPQAQRRPTVAPPTTASVWVDTRKSAGPVRPGEETTT